MKTIIHKVTWKAKFSKTKTDVTFEVTEQDCYVKKVSHPLGKWMLNQPWCRCYSWLKRKYADITSMEHTTDLIPIKNEDKYHHIEKNPKRLSQDEWIDRIQFTKG